MRVLHVLSSLQVGGAEVAALRLASAQQALGINVAVAGIKGGPLGELATKLGLSHATVGRGNGCMAAFGLLRLGFFFRPHVVNSHNPSAHKIAQVLRWPGRRIVMSLHGLPSRRYGELVESPTTAAVIAVSDRVRDRFLEVHPSFEPERVVTVVNGVEIPADTRKREHIGPLTVLVAARFDPIKDLETMVRAVAIVEKRIDVRLILAGEGPERLRLVSLISSLGLQSRVQLPGMILDMAPVYQDAHVVALSSTSEGMPMSLLEGMAWGLPVVATSVGGIPEVVKHGRSGFLVEPRDPAALADALLELAADPLRRQQMGATARTTVATRFSLDRMARGYHEVYMTVLDR